MVDDDPALAEMLGIVLRSEGFLPSFVADGERALNAFREARPDIVLLDLMLPGMSGIDVARAIRAESGIPIVMLTAKSDTVDVVLGLESGADDYVSKPFKPKELVARISLHTSMPSRPGSIRSSNTKSGRAVRNASNAPFPSPQNIGSKPSPRSTMPSISASAVSSSTTSTRPLMGTWCQRRGTCDTSTSRIVPG